MTKIFFLLITFGISSHSFAQNTRKERQQEKRDRISKLQRDEEEGVITYRKSFLFGAKLTTDGYGIFFELGRASSVKKSTLYQLEIAERKSPKEIKVTNLQYYNSVPFIYGKENFFYPVKLGVQQQLLLGNKSNKNGVAITANYGGGVALGILRPYYVQVPDGNGNLKYIKYNSADSSSFLSSSVMGGSNIGKGWNEITLTPGLYAKTAIRFDYGAYNEMISAIEVGVTAEYYSKKIPQMAHNPEKQFFFGAYVAILFGKRK